MKLSECKDRQWRNSGESLLERVPKGQRVNTPNLSGKRTGYIINICYMRYFSELSIEGNLFFCFR